MAHLNTLLLNLAVVANDVHNNKKRKNVDTPTTKAQKNKKRECIKCLLKFSHAQTVATHLTGFLGSEGVPLEVIRASAEITHFLAKSVKTLAVIAAADAAAEASAEAAAEAAAKAAAEASAKAAAEAAAKAAAEAAAEAAADETAADKTAADVAVDEAVVC